MRVVPSGRALLTGHDLQRSYIFDLLRAPWRLARGRAAVLGGALRRGWRLGGVLSDLPESPRWIINATCYETGKNWRFMRKRMGDYMTGYVASPTLPIAQAVAASAAVPGLIGSLRLRTEDYAWFKYDDAGRMVSHEAEYRVLRLWDGGVYDNLGVEALFKPSGAYREGFDFLVVSDASKRLGTEGRGFSAPLRLLDVATDQVRGLRARNVVSYLAGNPGVGVYLRMGNTEERIYRQAGSRLLATRVRRRSLGAEDVSRLAGMNTTLRRISMREFDLLYRHGYEVADATLSAYCGDRFGHLPLNS